MQQKYALINILSTLNFNEINSQSYAFNYCFDFSLVLKGLMILNIKAEIFHIYYSSNHY